MMRANEVADIMNSALGTRAPVYFGNPAASVNSKLSSRIGLPTLWK